jgi:hypothetical protein
MGAFGEEPREARRGLWNRIRACDADDVEAEVARRLRQPFLQKSRLA